MKCFLIWLVPKIKILNDSVNIAKGLVQICYHNHEHSRTFLPPLSLYLSSRCWSFIRVTTEHRIKAVYNWNSFDLIKLCLWHLPQICVAKLGRHWLRKWLVACMMNYDLSLITPYETDFNETIIKTNQLWLMKLHVTLSLVSMPPFCSGGGKLTNLLLTLSFALLPPFCSRILQCRTDVHHLMPALLWFHFLHII